MNNNDNVGGVCTAVSAVFTAVQADDIMRWISLAITILCGLVTLFNSIYKWYRTAKKDGKITSDEIVDLTDMTADELRKLQDEIQNDIKEKDDGNND